MEKICEDRVFKYKNRYLIYALHKQADSKKLVFVFSGVDSTPGACRMSYFALGKSLNANVVHIMDNYGTHGCYLLSVGGDQQIRNVVLQLIKTLQQELVCNDIYFIGTSKGATEAIIYSLIVGEGTVICGEPQVKLGDFIFNNEFGTLEQWRSLAYAITGRVDEADRAHLNEMIPDIVLRYGYRYRGTMEVHVGNTGYYQNHVKYLVDYMNDAGLSKCIKVVSHDFKQHNDVVGVFYAALESSFG